jgi:choline dehydrogenase
MLSGIGPADHLRSVGIDVVHDLKGVGENLHEHPNLLNIYRTRGQLGFTRHLRLDRATLAVAQWALFGTGPFTFAGTTANIFMRSRPELDRPDVQIIAMALHQHAELWFPLLTRPPVFAFTARVGVLHTVSRGWVRLRSSDPLALPRIRFNMFTRQPDMANMIAAVKRSRELFAQAPMRELIAEELLPGPGFRSDDELEQAIRAQAEHRHHAVGTCRLGTDELAVVDAQLKVHGIDNLRVADASVLPEDPSGNTNVPTMMIGEKAADMIRGRSLADLDAHEGECRRSGGV